MTGVLTPREISDLVDTGFEVWRKSRQRRAEFLWRDKKFSINVSWLRITIYNAEGKRVARRYF